MVFIFKLQSYEMSARWTLHLPEDMYRYLQWFLHVRYAQ